MKNGTVAITCLDRPGSADRWVSLFVSISCIVPEVDFEKFKIDVPYNTQTKLPCWTSLYR